MAGITSLSIEAVRNRARRLARPAMIAVTGLAVFCAWSWWRFGSIAFTFAYLNGFSVVAESPIASAGEVASGEMAVVTFRLKNLAPTPVTVLGARSSCGCTATDNLPMRVEPGQVADLRVRFSVRPAAHAAEVEHMIALCLDVDSPPVILQATASVAQQDTEALAAK